jgi:hypothetical protein
VQPLTRSQPARQPAPQRRAASASDRYLPAMPDMLRPPSAQNGPPRYGQATAGRSSTQGSSLVIRGQAPEEPATGTPKQQIQARLQMPTPEELGLLPAGQADQPRRQATEQPVQGDWSAARNHLEKLGASHYRLEKTPDGGYRFACALPKGGAPGHESQFEARAASEGEAIRLALEQVEAWRARSK